ncbi:unnamed protein product [Protopolystoma xenopodis]|uniref:Uncharacterized protein n=1 Tax=Protopolystoma xenopodis TaxID=117903 RepID=A0A3S5AFE3_9PLAT|nr:unnamed protein product [Protopolystoma xenopodis]
MSSQLTVSPSEPVSACAEQVMGHMLASLTTGSSSGQAVRCLMKRYFARRLVEREKQENKNAQRM